MITHYFKSAAVLVSIALAPSIAIGSCYICDEVVEVNDVIADCVISEYESIANEVSRSENGRSTIDLAACSASAKDGVKNRALSSLPELGHAHESSNLKTVYILDEFGLNCLKELIESHRGEFDPTVTFDLFESC